MEQGTARKPGFENMTMHRRKLMGKKVPCTGNITKRGKSDKYQCDTTVISHPAIKSERGGKLTHCDFF
jgi:hypothetical protein